MSRVLFKMENPKDYGFTLNPSGKRMYWKCPCDKWVGRCTKEACKTRGDLCGLKVGSAMCACGKERKDCPPCKKLFAEQKQELTALREKLGFRYVGKRWGCPHKNDIGKCLVSTCLENGEKCDLGVGCAFCDHLTKNGTRTKRQQCAICSPASHLINCRRCRRGNFRRAGRTTGTLEDLRMNREDWLAYLNNTFFNTYGRYPNENDETHIDEIVNCASWDFPEDDTYCWHYINSQLLLKKDNLTKPPSTQEEKEAMRLRIDEWYANRNPDNHLQGHSLSRTVQVL